MAPRLLGSLQEAGCRKPNCRRSGTLHRHHRRHEAMWFGIWASRRANDEQYQSLVNRYHEFREEDIVWLCEEHHAEIHHIYDQLIRDFKITVGKGLYRFSWDEASRLMDKLDAACKKWLETHTPGFDKDKLNKIRARRQKGRR
jgi:hypothetical protein